jgi:V/A-type H+/Na+-transporting ATPase subunit E
MSVKNGISAISKEVVGDAQKEAEVIILVAESEAKVALKAAKKVADQKYIEIINNAKHAAEAERRKIASVTEVELRNRLLETKEALVDGVFEKALGKFKDFVETEAYREYLVKRIEAVAEKIGQKDLVVQVNAKDVAWLTQDKLKPSAKKVHCELKLVKAPEQFIGGCIIQTADGKIIYNSTIDARLEELKPTLRVEVAKILFGEV